MITTMKMNAVQGIAHALVARQEDMVNENGRLVPFWHTRTGIIVKWSLFWALIFLFTLYVLVGYIHAKRRIRSGTLPLAYHRWLISRAELARIDPRYAYPEPAGYVPYPPRPEYYGMHAVPPPVYDPNAPRPPMYDDHAAAAAAASSGATKVDPNQWRPEPQQQQGVESFEPPTGPPPQARANTGGSNPFRG